MEEKKLDSNSIIGFLLLGAIMLWFMYTNQPAEQAEEVQKTEDVSSPNNNSSAAPKTSTTNAANLVSDTEAKERLGNFAYSSTLSVPEDGTTVIENNVLQLVISNKGGQIVEAMLKNYTSYDSLPLYIIKDANASFNINFGTTSNRIFNTKDLIFQPQLSQNGENSVLSMKLKVSETEYLEFRYELKPDEYMLGFAARSVGLGGVINSSNDINLNYQLKAFSHEKSMKYENQMTALVYEKEDNKKDDLSISGDDNEEESQVSWFAFKQHFFSTILLTETPFKTASLSSQTLFKDEGTDEVFTKNFEVNAPLELRNGELNSSFNLFIGPNDYSLLAGYEKNIENIVDLGWGIFGWINRHAFIPLFNLLGGLISSFGLVIILMTVVVRMFMSPLVYKSYLSSARMKVLKPEMTAINEKLPGKENAMKRQQETMALQRKAGVSMLAGCIPALLQMPVFFALFRFFPSAIDLRQQGFLWADDLSSYDSIYKLPFTIPLYGDHISLFPILASIAIFFYTQMTTGQQAMPQQPGMPNMKIIIYLMPLMMLFFFNNYASGLSLYYFISNLLTIFLMLIIKNYIIDDTKIHAKIEENKKKPKKAGGFSARLQKAMEEAEKQKNAGKGRRK